jgi:Cu2+-exporting ATPase
MAGHGHGHHEHGSHHQEHATSSREAGMVPQAHAQQPAHIHATGHEHGHDRHAGHSVAMFRDKFWVSLLLMVPTLVWGHMLPAALGFTPPHIAGSHWIPAVFGSAVFAYGGWPFLEGAAGELKDRVPGMMTLIALAISVAFVFSAAVMVGFPGTPLWEELATLVVIMLLGHWIEMRSITQAQGALKELAKLLPDGATRVVADGLEDVPVASLKNGDVVLIRPGGRVPADGLVRDGSSQVDESMLTGESRPVEKTPGSAVIAGTVNQSGALRVEVSGTGEGTALAGIMRLVEQAQQSKSRAQAVADRAAFMLTVIAILAASMTLIGWLVIRPGEPAFAVERMVTVLVIACPHALGLAVPLVIAISTTLGAQGGLLVRDRRGLEEARNLTAVVFDKTGTLTLGEHRVVDIATSEGFSAEEALRLGAALERDSEHPVARAIVKSAEERGLSLPNASDFRYLAGRGVSAAVDGRHLRAGGPNMLAEITVEPDRSLQDAAGRAADKGQGTIFLIDGDRAIAAFAVADAIRPESREAITRLHNEKIKVIMITGDAEPVARAVATELGIDEVLAQVLPEDKARRIEELQGRGMKVAMVGDGVNDAPALAVADVGVAIGAGTQVAVEAGDVVLVRSDPRDVPRIIRLSRASYRKMIQNLWWAAGYNIVAIPLAAGVMARLGIVLSPAVGAVLMSASTVIVAINAQLLRRIAL